MIDRTEYYNNVRNWLRLGLATFNEDGLETIPIKAIEAIFGKPTTDRVITAMLDVYETDDRKIGLTDSRKEQIGLTL